MNRRILLLFSFILSTLLLSTMLATPSQAQGPTLLHYWNFNSNITAKQTFPPPALKSNYSYVDTNTVVMRFDTLPATAKIYVDSLNGVSPIKSSNGVWDNTTAGDTLNARLGTPAGTTTSSGALRVRNPTWSSEMRFYVPTTFYSNISIKYALQSSSSGQKTEQFAYSTDSGLTWKGKAAGLTVNGANVDTIDCTQAAYQQSTAFGLVTIGFGTDTTVNNNPRLVFRIRFPGANNNNSTFTGNNRFDNFTVEAVPVPRTIVISKPALGDTLISGNKDTIRFTISGKISRIKQISISLDSGLTWTRLKYDSVSGIEWLIPQVINPTNKAMVALTDSTGVTGYSPVFTIMPYRMPLPPPTLVHYWHFNGTSSAVYEYPNLPIIPADFTVHGESAATMAVGITASAPTLSSMGLIKGVPGDLTNDMLNYPSGNALQFDNPSDSTIVVFNIPTLGRHNVSVTMAVKGSGTPKQLLLDYSTDGGTTWTSSNMTSSVVALDQSPFSSGWGLVTADLSSVTAASNNAKLAFRIRTANGNGKTTGYFALDNVAVLADPGASSTSNLSMLMHYWHFKKLTTAYHNPNIPTLKADYSAIDTNAAKVSYVLWPGTSSTYAGYIDNVAADTTNAQLGIYALNALRVRNPSDSMELRINIPSTGYQDINVTYGLESSSTNSGQLTELFDYSVDNGQSWKSAGMSVNGVAGNTLDVTQSKYQGTSWGLVSIGFGSDAAVNNNPNLMLRIKFTGNAEKTSGNNRFENIAVFGRPYATPKPPLVQYWHFNAFRLDTLNGLYPTLPADYSAPGAGYGLTLFKNLPGILPAHQATISAVTGDATNVRGGQLPGMALRVSNPSDSAELRFLMPSAGYRNLSLKFAQHATSQTPLAYTELFDYSIDGGRNWRTGDLTVNGSIVNTLDLTQYQGATWSTVAVNFGGDTSVNNNPNLIFRVRFFGAGAAQAGSTLFDNVTLEADKIPAPTAAIHILRPAANDTVIGGKLQVITYSVSGPTSEQRSIALSTDNGTTWTTVAPSVNALNFSWVVPMTPSAAARIRITDMNGVSAISAPFVIVVPGTVSSVTLSEVAPSTGMLDSIMWSATGYLGETVNVDVSYDNKNSWTPVVIAIPSTLTKFAWVTPVTTHSGVIIRVKFSSGAVGYSAPFNIHSLSGVNASNESRSVAVWPNPAMNTLSIRSDAIDMQNTMLTIRDVEGLAQSVSEISTSDHVKTVDVATLSAGTYFWSLENSAKHLQGKFVIAH